MPRRKPVKSLEALSLAQVEEWLKAVVEQACHTSSQIFARIQAEDEANPPLSRILYGVEHVVDQIQVLLFHGTAQTFHPILTYLVVRTLSGLMPARRAAGRDPTTLRLPVRWTAGPDPTLMERKLTWLREQVVLSFSRTVCHQHLQELNLSPQPVHLGPPSYPVSASPSSCPAALSMAGFNQQLPCVDEAGLVVGDSPLHPDVVQAVVDQLVHCPQLARINLINQSVDISHTCASVGSSKHRSGLFLQYLPRLTTIWLNKADISLVNAIANLCPRVRSLALGFAKSEVMEEALSAICSLVHLEYLDLRVEGLIRTDVSPYAFAELLRRSRGILHLGQCPNFGQVLTTLYAPSSLYRRSVGAAKIQPYLQLESVDCGHGTLSTVELMYLVAFCPRLKSLTLAYNATRAADDSEMAVDRFGQQQPQANIYADMSPSRHRQPSLSLSPINVDDVYLGGSDQHDRLHDLLAQTEADHLDMLNQLEHITCLSISSCDFYSHSLFSIFNKRHLETAVPQMNQVPMCQLTRLELIDIDELNLAAVMMIGEGCPSLARLAISHCHYTPEPRDRQRLEAACSAGVMFGPELSPFWRLRQADFVLDTSVHLPLLKYTVFFARNIVRLSINQMYQPAGDSFVLAILTWNPFQHLEHFEMDRGPHLSVMAANSLIEACPRLKHVGRIANWGHVERSQLAAMKQEIVLRNLDLVLE